MSSATMAVQVILLLIFVYFLYALFLRQKQRNVDRKHPPGPLALPIIGNLHMLGALPHRSLQSLAKKYGPIMSMRLGQVPTFVVSTSEAAEMFLKTHDIVFASRPKPGAAYELLTNGSKGLAFAEYGPYWRNARKLCTLHLLSSSKIQLFAPLRREELGVMVKSLEKAAAVGQVVNVSEVAENVIEDIVYQMILGHKKNDHLDLKRIIQELLSAAQTFNLADYLPWLGAFDLQGLTRASMKIGKELDKVLVKIIEEHEEAANVDNGRRKDFVDVLLARRDQYIDPESEENLVDVRISMKGIFLDMIVGAIDTSAFTIAWALAELLRHPRLMKILQDEIKNEVGMRRMVEETDLPRLSYLDMVVNETLRLYPPGPLLVPRESRENITIDGYFIEKKSRIIVNAWAIGRDPNVWSDNAETFYPERFINRKVDFSGPDLQFIPFGYGRRSCAGTNLGLTMVRLVLAQLVHCFNWELPRNVSPANLDMQEKFGLSIKRAQPLQAIPTYRLIN